MLYRSVKINCRKNIFCMITVLCIVMVLCLCLVTEVWSNSDNGEGCSVLSILFLADFRQFCLDNNISAQSVIRAGVSDWLVMFSPVICTLSFVRNACESTSLRRFEYIRNGKLAGEISVFISGMLCGGVVMLSGYGLFLCFATIVFPSSSEFSREVSNMLMHGQTMTAFYFSRLVGSFFMGAFSIIPAYIISLFSRNKFLIVCLPFMICHLYTSVLNKIAGVSSKAIRPYIRAFLPDGIFSSFENNLVWLSIVVSFILVVFAGIVGIISVKRRNDCCE